MAIKEVGSKDIQLFHRCETIAKNNDIMIEVRHSTFVLYEKGILLGKIGDL